uniref:Ig-like domain-containing protein n=1 Tax=Anopheles quadriannulatus TaxID=34691 RepID=A0A182X0F5_ANOQN
ITKSLQTFSEEQFLLELSDDRSSSPVTRPPIRNRTPPYLGNLHLGFHQHQQHHHQLSETSENEIYDSDESNLLRTPLDRGPHFDLSASKNITALVGKTAYLNCRVKNIGNKTEINYDSPRGGVSVITEKGELTTSYLLIQRARTTDSGKYVCSPSNADPSTINVHILNGNVRPPYSLTASRAMTNTTVFARCWQHFRHGFPTQAVCIAAQPVEFAAELNGAEYCINSIFPENPRVDQQLSVVTVKKFIAV